MEKYLEHKRRVNDVGLKRSQTLVKGAPCEIDHLGLPVGNNCDQFDENGQKPLEVRGSDGEKILYRQESIERLIDNNSLRYESGMKSFIDDYLDHSSHKVHKLTVKTRATKMTQSVDIGEARFSSNKKAFNRLTVEY